MVLTINIFLMFSITKNSHLKNISLNEGITQKIYTKEQNRSINKLKVFKN